MRVLAEYVIKSFGTFPIRRVALAKLKSSYATMSKRYALVLGNGPSVSTLDIAWLHKHRSAIDVFAVNWFPLSPLSTDILPDFVVLSDPQNFPGNTDNPKNKLLWEKLEELQPKIFLPFTLYSQLQRDQCVPDSLKEKIYFFNDLGLEGWTKNISPLRPRGYLSLTAYKALAISIFLGYKQIFILGIDNTMYQTVDVDQNNSIHLDGNHFYQDEAKTAQGPFYPTGMADVFYDYSLCFFDLHRCFGARSEVMHLDPLSKVDAFCKRDADQFPQLDEFK